MGARQLRITYGGWYPRTTIHLREIYDFFALGHSNTKLDPVELKHFQGTLDLTEVSREAGNLEFVQAKTKNGIEIRYYEDGLFTFSLAVDQIRDHRQILERYYQERFNPALNYLFSLGAPTPKILAKIKSTHPTVISVETGSAKADAGEFVSEYIYEHVQSDGIDLYKTDHFFLIVSKKGGETIQELVEMQIFFREFKDQLERYLNIHREIWEEIETIKEQHFLRGQDIDPIRSRLDNYQKTINLISSRIKQMGTYIETRKSIAAKTKIETTLSTLFQYKFEVLENTLSYIQEIWVMTDNYLTSALEVVSDIQAQSSQSSIDSLRTITTVGVISGLIGYFAKSELPEFTSIGLQYFVLLILLAVIINGAMGYVNRRRRYQVTIGELKLK